MWGLSWIAEAGTAFVFYQREQMIQLSCHFFRPAGPESGREFGIFHPS